jgi:hypothetical protein|tara:strand:- start:239 stop:343 length:105 start_codon:yes stop_codon:yes gene_type:complete
MAKAIKLQFFVKRKLEEEIASNSKLAAQRILNKA